MLGYFLFGLVLIICFVLIQKCMQPPKVNIKIVNTPGSNSLMASEDPHTHGVHKGKRKSSKVLQPTTQEARAKREAFERKIKRYVDGVQAIHRELESSANQALNKQLKGTVGVLLTLPETDCEPLEDRLSLNVAKTLKQAVKLAKAIGLAGDAVGKVVDLLCMFGIVSDDSIGVLDEIVKLRGDMKQGFEEIMCTIELQPFLQVFDKLQAKLQLFEQNLGTTEASVFYERVGTMVQEYPPDKIISDLKQMHNMITGESVFKQPLFMKLAEKGHRLEGAKLDEFIANILLQFQSVLALEISAVRMLRSFILFTEQDEVFATDLKSIFRDLANQQLNHDPSAIYEWYLNFRLHGGTFLVSTVQWPKRYVYVQKTFGGNLRGLDQHPGKQGVFDIMPHKGATFLVSPKKWPGWFMYMYRDLEGNVTSWKGDPGPQGHWMFTIKDIEKRTFLISPKMWPNWYIYMRGNALTMNVRGYKGDPGPQGHFILTELIAEKKYPN